MIIQPLESGLKWQNIMRKNTPTNQNCHSCESRNLAFKFKIPAFAGMTYFLFALVLIFSSSAFSAQKDIEPLIEKAHVLIEQGAYPAGISILETVLDQDPKNPEILNSLLEVYDLYSE